MEQGMDTIQLINLLPYTFLNPLILMAYIFSCSESELFQGSKIQSFYDIGGNSQRINLGLYLGFCVLASALFISFKLVILLPLATTDVTALDFILIEPSWSEFIAYIATLFTLSGFLAKDGIEANVAGFIFFPFLMLGAVLLVINHVSWLWAKVI